MFWVWSVGDLKDEGEFFEPHEGWGAARKEDMHHVPLRAFRHSSLVPLLVPRASLRLRTPIQYKGAMHGNSVYYCTSVLSFMLENQNFEQYHIVASSCG